MVVVLVHQMMAVGVVIGVGGFQSGGRLHQEFPFAQPSHQEGYDEDNHQTSHTDGEDDDTAERLRHWTHGPGATVFP